MKKLFSNVQTLKSSDDCKKYSKSVSYETLAIGATAIGSAYKQTQRLSECCTNYRFCKTMRFSCENLVDGLLQTLPAFRLVKILSLVVFLSAVIISESHAEETSTIVTGTCNDDETCLWKFDTSTGKMTISAVQGTGKVSMKNYFCNDDTRIGNRPWENYITQIKDIVVEENITNIGDEAFQNATELLTVTGMNDVKSIGHDAFAWVVNLTHIDTPAVEYLASYSLAVGGLTSIDLPNIKRIDENFSWAPLQYVGLPDYDVSINPDAFTGVLNLRGCSNENRAACGSCGNDYVKRGVGCVKDCGSGYLGKEGRCIDASSGCGAGYRQFENFCNRIQYTPAEAAKVLRDDNKNEVIITFKK